MEDAYKMMVGKLEGKALHVRCRNRWEDNIKMNLKKIVFGGVDWIHLAEDRGPVVGSCGNGDEPLGSIK
jgi:hypothetical protein